MNHVESMAFVNLNDEIYVFSTGGISSQRCR